MIQLTNRPLMIASEYVEPMLNFEWIPKGKFETLDYSIKNGVAIIPIHGLLTKRSERFYQTTNYADILMAIADALYDNQVESILLDIDSPGGEVGGLFDLVDFIYESRDQKPIYAYANDSAFSAAYAIASACSKIFINRTSGVGSIGVIATHTDISEADKKLGVKYTTIFAGDKKNDLTTHEPLSESAKEELQAEVNRLYELFLSTVARNRGISTELVRATQAATYYGENAINIALADELTGNPLKSLRKIGVGASGISKLEMKGEEMTEDIKSPEGEVKKEAASEMERYKAEILEITQLCKLAHAEDKISEFVEENLTAAQVREKLLTHMQTQEEIFSAHYQKDEVKENPVVAAAKKIAANSK